MSIEATLQRISVLESMLAFPQAGAPAAAATATPAVTATSSAMTGIATDDGTGTSDGSFTSALQAAGLPAATGAAGTSATAAPATGGTNAGRAALAAAQGEVGQAEQPGSNDSLRIAQYRKATAGSGVGPWCAYFVSWAARQAGAPIGDSGQGYGSVSDVAAWGQRTGRSLPAGSKPQPGDLIVWGSRHIGIVESVDASGSIHTIEGNSSDRVSRRTYGPDGGGATSYVRLG